MNCELKYIFVKKKKYDINPYNHDVIYLLLYFVHAIGRADMETWQERFREQKNGRETEIGPLTAALSCNAYPDEKILKKSHGHTHNKSNKTAIAHLYTTRNVVLLRTTLISCAR